MPMAKEINPKLVFDRLFGSRSREGSPSERVKRELYQKSILDLVWTTLSGFNDGLAPTTAARSMNT